MNGWLGVSWGYYFRMNIAQCHKILNSGLFLKIQKGNIHSTITMKSDVTKIIKGALHSPRKVIHYILNIMILQSSRNLKLEARQCVEVLSEPSRPHVPSPSHNVCTALFSLNFIFFPFHCLTHSLSFSSSNCDSFNPVSPESGMLPGI